MHDILKGIKHVLKTIFFYCKCKMYKNVTTNQWQANDQYHRNIDHHASAVSGEGRGGDTTPQHQGHYWEQDTWTLSSYHYHTALWCAPPWQQVQRLCWQKKYKKYLPSWAIYDVWYSFLLLLNPGAGRSTLYEYVLLTLRGVGHSWQLMKYGGECMCCNEYYLGNRN